jgi:hypothetical protein
MKIRQQLLRGPPDKLQLLQFRPSNNNNNSSSAPNQNLTPLQAPKSRKVRPIRPKLLKRATSSPAMADQAVKNGQLLLKVRVIQVRHPICIRLRRNRN